MSVSSWRNPEMLLVVVIGLVAVLAKDEAPQHWIDDAKRDIERALNLKREYGVAKNAILMVGDGMGIPSVTAGRIWKGQLNGQSGEENKLSFENFPNVGLSKTYNVDRQVPDSAGTANAMMSGIKANVGTLGVNSYVAYGASCDTYREDRRTTSVLDHALANVGARIVCIGEVVVLVVVVIVVVVVVVVVIVIVVVIVVVVVAKLEVIVVAVLVVVVVV
ncbi:alkaline phosphatase [Elysia marginata]|uniref:alkaline phosphatase n=1 Tax=Elysia marginata TaxID=1093978 RepID=A0AAV4FBU0_9GAST|nr:alkaline phosphatase [Elysia marginata]